jgi:iron complex outermembrane receptor protein
VTAEDYQRRRAARAQFDNPFSGIKSIKLNFSYSDYEHTEFEGLETGTIFEKEGYDGRIDIVHEKVGLLEGAFGLQTQRTRLSALGGEAYTPPVETVQHSAFVFKELDFSPAKLQFGVRFDHTTLDRDSPLIFGPARSREYHALSGALSVV